jgi:hypothetical protein
LQLLAHKIPSKKEMKVDKTTLVLGMFAVALAVGFLGRYSATEGFMQKAAGMPMEGPAMGPYDTAMGGWMSSEHMPVGSMPQNQAMEGNKLMFLVGNKTDPSCCPAAFTTDSGCVCLTGADSDLMARRGGNK